MEIMLLDENELKRICDSVGATLANLVHNSIAGKLGEHANRVEKIAAAAEQRADEADARLTRRMAEIVNVDRIFEEKEKRNAELQQSNDALQAVNDRLLPIVAKLRAEHQSYQQQIRNILS